MPTIQDEAMKFLKDLIVLLGEQSIPAQSYSFSEWSTLDKSKQKRINQYLRFLESKKLIIVKWEKINLPSKVHLTDASGLAAAFYFLDSADDKVE